MTSIRFEIIQLEDSLNETENSIVLQRFTVSIFKTKVISVYYY